jgi:flagellin
MALVVNTNVQALNAQRNLDKSSALLNKALERLSSGLRINNAGDDSAGLVIATRLNAQVRGLSQAIRNANDGAAILGTAEGALGEITNILTRVKELAVQSANGTNSNSDRSSLNAEVQALISEVTRIAGQTKFGNTALLDGSFSGVFQVGVNAAETVGQSIGNYKASALSGAVASQTLTFLADTVAAGTTDANSFLGLDTSTDLQISGPKGSTFVRTTTSADDSVSFLQGARSAIAVAKAINEATSVTGVSATVGAAVFTSVGGAPAFDRTFDIDGSTNVLQINGQSVIVNLNGGSVATRRQQFLDAVNTQVSGVTAKAGSIATSVVLTAADGRNISILASGATTATVGGLVFGFTDDQTAEVVRARGTVTLQAGGTITTVLGDATTQAQVGGEGQTNATGVFLNSLSVTTLSNSNTTLFVVDAILDTISSARGDIGAVQNRLASTVATLSTVAEKVSDARSRILDADFAAETAALTKAQILQQAGISVLAQANNNPQVVLSLLPR